MKNSGVGHRRRGRTRLGFTLLEMTIVLFLIGITAAIAIPKLSQSAEQGKSRACATDQEALRAALESYHAAHGSYPNGTDAQAIIAALQNDGAIGEVACPSGGQWEISLQYGSGQTGAAGENPLDDTATVRCTVHGELYGTQIHPDANGE
ncbi:MAG: prepilin-type N-terminal cleavage/methylation domain-containing protein [Firmicutes bacterium]|nr:prepilin-type N-terminal cleavage/methylation domain-containing protein [Bacillota bacterium]